MPVTQKRDHTISRRATLAALLGAGSTALFIPAWNETVEAADNCVPATPTVTEGPYWVDEKLFRSDIRTDPDTGAARTGLPLTLTINVQNLSTSGCSPLAGAYVDIWHCDAKGIYSDEGSYNPGGGTGTVVTKGQKFLRGYQITNDNGQVQFTTIYPGWYSGRTIHIHVRIRTYSGTTILSNFVTQIFFDDAVNNAVMALPSYYRTSSRDVTNATDMVYRVANPERMLASAAGSTESGYTSTITLGAAFKNPTASAPTIATGGVENAMSGVAGVAPGAWISIYGSALSSTARALATGDLVNNTIPTTLAGVSVQINGKAAYVHYVSSNQINVLAPSDTTRGSVAVTVTNASGTSNSVITTMQEVLPGLSVTAGYVNATAIGPGDSLSLYGAGFGSTLSSLADGAVFTGAYPTTNPVTVTIGGIAATVLFAGLIGAGLYQINVTVPTMLVDGDHAVIATVAGASSQSSALLKVAARAKLAT